MRVEDKVRLLIKMVSTYSPSGRESEIAKAIYEFLREGCDDVFIDEVGNVIAIRGSGSPVLWLHAHMDTIPGELEVRVSDGVVYGLGAADDKASLTAMMIAISEVDRAPCKVVFTGVVDEEGDSTGTRHLIERCQSVVPRPDGVIVGEPTGVDRIVTTYRGSLKAYIRARSRGGHSSTPISAPNPIDMVYSAYIRIREALGAGDRFETITVVPTVMRGGDVENRIPTFAELVLDIRVPPSYSCRQVVERIERVSRELEGVEISLSRCVEAVLVSISNPAARAVARAIIRVLGVKPIPARKWGTSDMNELIRICKNMVAYGPGEFETAHSTLERVRIDDFLRSIEVYKTAISEFVEVWRRSTS